MDAKRIVAKRIRIARVELGINQSQLAEAVGTTQMQISKAESGKVSIGVDSLERIAIALGRPIEYFFQAFDNSSKGIVYQETKEEFSRPKARTARQGKKQAA